MPSFSFYNGYSPRRSAALIIMTLMLVLTACSSGNLNNNTSSAGGGLLNGPDSASVAAAVRDVDIDTQVDDSQICTDSYGCKIARTQMEIVFTPAAEVWQANILLAGIGAEEIISSVAGVAALLVRIPDPGCIYSMNNLITAIESDPIVWYVRPGYLPQTMSLPENIDPAGSEISLINPLLAVRAPAAWNARRAIAAAPRLIVADAFGGGPPDTDISYKGVPGDFNTVNFDAHGYHVLSVIAGAFGGGLTDRGMATGIYPAAVNLRVVDTGKNNSMAYYENKIIAMAKTLPGNIILNTALGYHCQGVNQTCMPAADAKLWATVWAAKIRTAGLEDRLLHLTAAGNIADNLPAVRDAATASTFAAAHLLTNLQDADGAPVADLDNTVVVENDIAAADPPDHVKCLNETSFTGGDLGGVGTDVWSIADASSSAAAMSGSSMATAQAAGLAAYLWSIKPELSPQQLIALLLQTAHQVPITPDAGCSDEQRPAPVIDAYDALLALDNNGLFSGEPDYLDHAPVRAAILDVADDNGLPGGNGHFDEKDIEILLAGLTDSPGVLNYGPADLNGDGRTGGPDTAAFDLDIDSPPNLGLTGSEIAGQQVFLDEKALTDLQILCYYAYSPLFTGEAAQRDTLLAPFIAECGVTNK